ncbi:MAG: hypothetical protein A2W17_08680 [Planctomycetes bacterium RBG_16_41_13]|nr:MAG: hypothetical protein A2W17_08680 [Planctomycetes bacterium RBG_16_41_13]
MDYAINHKFYFFVANRKLCDIFVIIIIYYYKERKEEIKKMIKVRIYKGDAVIVDYRKDEIEYTIDERAMTKEEIEEFLINII